MSTTVCPSCGKGLISPHITNKPILLLKQDATYADLNNREVFSLNGKNKRGYAEYTTSYYLRKELAIVGLQMSQFNQASFWMHSPPKGRKTKEQKKMFDDCHSFCTAEVIGNFGHVKLILLMGAELVKEFTGYNASSVYGLRCKSPILPNVNVIIPAPNPDKMMSQPIGELRLSLKRFAEECRIIEQYGKI